MQDVAADAHMSPGNLYRYFPSKNALIAGLVITRRAPRTDTVRAGLLLWVFGSLLQHGEVLAHRWIVACDELAPIQSCDEHVGVVPIAFGDQRPGVDQLPRLAQVWPEMAQRLADLERQLDERPDSDGGG